MKQEFEMGQQEMDDIISINKNMSPVMKFGDYWSGMDLTERINEYWKVLGDKYGFKPLSVEPSSRGALFFLAEPKPIEVPLTETQKKVAEYVGKSMGYLNFNVTDSLKAIIKQLEDCEYQNEAGLLINNIAFMALKEMAL